jgi:competence protein ComEC
VRLRLDHYGPHIILAAMCAGIAIANAVRVSPGLGASCLAALSIAAVARAPRFALVAFALLLAGWWWGSLRLDVIDQSQLASEIGRAGRARAVVTGPARRGAFRLRVPARMAAFDGRQVDEPVLLELPHGRSPPQGAVIEMIGELRRPRAADAGFDERAWLRRHGVHAVLRGGRWRVVGHRGGLLGLADRLRVELARTLAPGVGGERRALLAGVVLGEDEGLSKDTQETFRVSGLYHLLAVSGQNVALVAGSVLLLAWVLGIPRLLAELGALGAITGYVLAVGAQPSVVRAGVAGALGSLAWLASRERDRWWFLLLGALVLLAWSPYNLLDPGFQLSFAAVVAIFTLVPLLMRRLEGYPVPRFLGGILAVSTACGLATAPIVWLHFGAVPAYSVLSNAMAEPAVAPLLWLALASVAIHPLVPDAAAALGWLNGWLAAYIALCARAVAALPGARLSSPAALAGALVLAIVMAALVFSRRRRAIGVTAAALALAFVAGCSLWPGGRPLPPPAGLRITFLDVGQGDSVLLQVPEGALLVDEGPPEARVDRQLARLGIRQLALVVLTHPQRDHVGGARLVLGRQEVGAVVDPRIPSESSDEGEALREARERGVKIVTARAGLLFRLGRLRLRVLWPDGSGSPGEDPNQHAVVILASYGAVDVLLTADAESDVLLPLRLPPVEILKVSHHGSADPGLPALLETIRPQVAVISVGAGNDYGHPAPSTLAALGSAPQLAVYRTDLDGRVVVESDGRTLRVHDQR